MSRSGSGALRRGSGAAIDLKRRATLGDIARILGVSQATVSRALRDDPQIGSRTREAVRLVAAELQYVPNHAARSLVKAATMTLGLLIPDAIDQLHGLVVKGFQEVAMARGYAAIVAAAFRDPAEEHRVYNVFRSFQVDAVALYGTVSDVRQAAEAVGPVPIIFIAPESPSLGVIEPPSGPTVLQIETEAGIRDLVQHLLATGRRRISYVNGPDIASNTARRRAISRTLERAGIEPRVREYPPLTDEVTTREVVESIMRESPDALVCYDDATALNAMARLARQGVTIPGDLAVTGFDDIPYASMSRPGLTTVAQPAELIGRRAASAVLDTLATGDRAPSDSLPVALVVRESTAAARD